MTTTFNDIVARRKAVQDKINKDKKFGKDTVLRTLNEEPEDIDSLSTGLLPLDDMLGVGGLPKGRIIEIFGPESSSKTTICLQAIAECQRKGGLAAFLDVEHALDRNWAKKFGVDLDNLLFLQPDTAEEAMRVAQALVGEVDIIVLDSVAALTPQAELEGEIGDSHMALVARLMGQSLRILTGEIKKSNTVMVFINQLRSTMNSQAFAKKEDTPGGKALKFYATVRLDIRRIQTINKGDDAVGIKIKVKSLKNKVAPPFMSCELILKFTGEFDTYTPIIDKAVDLKLIKKSGTWFSLGDERLGQGKDNVIEFFKENDDIFQDIKAKVLAKDETTDYETKEEVLEDIAKDITEDAKVVADKKEPDLDEAEKAALEQITEKPKKKAVEEPPKKRRGRTKK